MKDKVFIAWSGSNAIAMKVKRILEEKHNYYCAIGGNSDNSSSFASVGDTVIQQIKTCNQAIVVFQNKVAHCPGCNRAENVVSNNLFFELGYVLSQYGQKKVHCVKRNGDDIVLPSDFDNSFVETICGAEGKTSTPNDDEFAEGIVRYFLERQKMSINTNKMYLINNRYMMHDYIRSHYSEQGSKCSDYELAQYVIFYMQASHMFGDGDAVSKEITAFRQDHHYDFSPELALAVNICLSFSAFAGSIHFNEDGNAYIEKNVFIKFRRDYDTFLKLLVSDEMGTFDNWARVFLYNHMSYGYNLFANNKKMDESLRMQAYALSLKATEDTEKAIQELERVAPVKESNDVVGILSLIRAYVYRNAFLCSRRLGKEEEALEWLRKTMNERISLKQNFEIGTIDSQLYENFAMEYYLSRLEYLENKEALGLDPFDCSIWMEEIETYISEHNEKKNETDYFNKVEFLFRRMAGDDDGDDDELLVL